MWYLDFGSLQEVCDKESEELRETKPVIAIGPALWTDSGQSLHLMKEPKLIKE